MKKYKLLKSLPLAKEGEVVELSEDYDHDTEVIIRDRRICAVIKKDEVNEWLGEIDLENQNDHTKTLEYINGLISSIPNNMVEKISDGYHTFTELYDYRRAYNALLANEYAKQGLYNVHKSWRHNDGQECFGGGWFVVQMDLPTGQISNHYEAKYWNEFQCEEREISDAWDGHTPQEALERMIQFLNNNL